jgi:serine/threonine protein kinase/tetratricopeptide (TPR) repeat protein
MDDWLGPYRLLRRLGEGSLGTVYKAEDARLGRTVALKTLRRAGSDLDQRERLLREARTAAGLRHPAVCHVFEVGEAEGELFVAMEFLEGESLAARVARGPLPVREAAAVLLEMLTALDELHRQNLVHGDLKPSNAFQTPHGLKLLDFGMAKRLGGERQPSRDGAAAAASEASGVTPYMAPEQLSTGAWDSRADVWAAGAILYELLIGQAPFRGSPAEIRQAVLKADVPPLGGSAGIAGVDHVVHRALARPREERYASAEAMARGLRLALDALDSTQPAVASRMTRLIALPLRLLRPDADIAFLSFSLADAISTSLASHGSLIVRSSLAAARLVTDPLDLRVVAEDADVDVVVSGTLLRAGTQVRVSVQLLEAPSGTLLWSQTRQLPLEELFELQDTLASGIAESLALPLTSREQRLPRDAPASPRAYERYLKANQLFYDPSTWEEARQLYEQCVEEDPSFAPAWARLGRMHRVQAKYGQAADPEAAFSKADAALTRALDLNPDLPIAHSFYASVEVDTGRAEQAMTRLLTRAAGRRGDVDLMVGLVQACRFCGLLDASAAAHVQARRLDPHIPTSVLHTWWMMGEYGRVLDGTEQGTDPIKSLVLAVMGRTADALVVLAEEERRFLTNAMSRFVQMVRMVIEGDAPRAIEVAGELRRLVTGDPEANLHMARVRAKAGDDAGALEGLRRAVDLGFFCTRIIRTDPWLASIRQTDAFAAIVADARKREERAARLFRDAGGETLLGVTVTT